MMKNLYFISFLFFIACGNADQTSNKPAPINWETIQVGQVAWATKNLGASESYDYGNYYTYEEAIDACPEGWRLPTTDEFEELVRNNGDSRWDKQNGINGRFFGQDLFFPACGYKNAENGSLGLQGEVGNYWSSNSYLYSGLFFDNSYVLANNVSDKKYMRCVRCVKD